MSQPSQNPSQQPVSFKTVPGRNRTQKWTQAKTNNYDGDDWGGYDDYDDYGGYSEQSSTQQNSGPQLQRQSSFDRGVDTERRQFSSGTAIYEPERYTSPNRTGQGNSQDGRSPEDTRRRMREFSNPGQVPQPLNTPRSPATPGSVDRPPRKSSLGGSPAPGVRAMPATTSPSLDKPLPFVRPSDIYKRMEEERQKERQSMESGRPSMDALHRETGSPPLPQHALHRKKSQESLPSNSGRRPSLEPVSETKELKSASPALSLPAVAEQSTPAMTIAQPSIPPTESSDQQSPRLSDSSPRLPPVSRLSGFGSFLPRDEEEERLSATGLAASTAAANAAASALSSGSRDITPTMPYHQSSDIHSQPTQGNDPAAEIAAERSTGAPVEQLGRSADEHPAGLSHQPSAGFRSVVHKAFDNQGDSSVPASPSSRDETQSGVFRSDTNSTRSISPIMSRVPSVATAQQKQQERDAVVPSIAEETPLEVAKSRPSYDSTAPPIVSRPSIMRKPTPNHSRNVSSEIPGFTPGYRRSMDTPSPNNSPARTPGLGDIDSRRLSGPMSAVTVNDPEAPDVDPSAPEMPSATLEPVETPLETPDSTFPGASGPEVVKPLPTTGRGRSGTDYSVRESDLALEAKTSPENSPSVAEAATIQQNLFLDTHPSNPGSPVVLSPTGFARPFPHPATSGSGRSSPAGTSTSRSRVRNMVDQFHQIDEDSKRNSVASAMSSKSSWSNFGADDDVVIGLNRRTTGGSALSPRTPGTPGESAMFPAYDQADQNTSTIRAATSPTRPAAERQESFKPHLPGEWISAAPTPASEVSEPALHVERGRDQTNRDITPVAPPTPEGAPLASPEEEVDLTPTTRKTKLHGRDSSVDVDESESALAAVKNAGDALGTSFMTSAGFGHQTRDFANPGSAAPVDVPELRPHRQTGNIEYLNLPILRRGDSDAPSDGTNSVANSVPPTPPAKDTPQPPGLTANAGPDDGRPTSNYFAGVAPLSFGKHSPNNSRDVAATRPTVLPTLSTDTRATDLESDRLRKDIYRSLGSDKMDEIKRESILEDADRTQDALDAPDNEHRIASGQSALPPAETKSSDARSGLPSQARPGLLNQRFSWENRSADSSTNHLYAPMAVVGETKGDEGRESYERPRSNQGLHVVNTQVVADSEPSTADTDKQPEPHFMLNEAADAEKRLSTGLPIGTAALALGSQGNDASKDAVSPVAESPDNSIDGLDNLAPTPMVEDVDEAARTTEPLSPIVPPKEASPALPSPSTATAKPSTAAHSKLPSFRDLAAIKNTDERIAAYETTRRRFADMNTGISGWLSNMLATHPEYANAGNQKYEGPAVIQTAGLSNTLTGLGGTIGGTIRGASHKHSPSILKIGGERKASTTSTTGTTPTTASTSTHQDVEKMQAKGKDFMKSAGAGAKGLFAKGKSRFGRSGEKGSSSSISSPLVIAPAFASAPVDPSSSSKNLSSTASHPASATSTATITENPTRTTTTPAAANPPSRPITPAALQTTVSDNVGETDRVTPAAERERPRSVFGRLRDVSRSGTRSRSRSGSIVFGTGWGDSTTSATTPATATDHQRKSPGPSRSASRPASLILGRGRSADNGETDQTPSHPPMPPSALERTRTKTPPAPILTSPTTTSAFPLVMPGPEDRRREAWEDDGAEVGDASGWRDEHGRLGVLPSPSVQESVGPASPGKARKGSWIGEVVGEPAVEEKKEEEREEGGEGLRMLEAEHDVVSSNAEGLIIDLKQQDKPVVQKESTAVPAPQVEELSASEPDVRRSSLDNAKVRRPSVKHAQSRSASSALPASTTPRPQPERKFSALDQLPSQQRRRQFTPVTTPRRTTLADDTAPSRIPEPLPPFAPLQNQTSRTQGNSDFLADVRPSPTKASRPSTPANWDKLSAVSSPKAVDDAASRRSSVSSLGNPQSPDTIVIPGAASKRQSIIGMPSSTLDEMVEEGGPRSVSPLGFGGDCTDSRTMTMEPDTMSGGGQPQGDGFMNRDYRTDQMTEQRPMSYMPLSRGSSGVMAQDTIDVTQPGKRYSTASGMADYSVPGAFPYPQQQQQPSQPTSRAPSIKQPPSEYDKLRSPQAGDADPVATEHSSKHSSGFFRGPDLSASGGPGAIPSPSKLDANYDGLIDPQVDQLADDIAKAEQPQKRRKSGIMDSFRRASTYSSANASRPSSREGLSSNANESALAKSKTLKKPQRAASSAVEPPKNKRFSGLGSLFRRSSTMTPRNGAPAGTQAGVKGSNSQTASPVTSKASKKLTKTQPPQQQQQQQQYSQPPANYYAGPPPGNYAAYEAMMRQQGPPGQGQQMPPQYWQQQQPQQMYAEPALVSSPYQPQAPAAAAGAQRQSGYYQQGPPQAQYQQYPPQGANQPYQNSTPNSRTHSLVSSPVSEQAAPFEYYGSPQSQPAQPMPQPRRLHSEGHWRRDTVPDIPEAHSPVDSSKATSVAPVHSYTDGHVDSASAQGSPQQQVQPVSSRPPMDTRQSSTYSQGSVVRSPGMAQIPDNFPQAPGRQDYQTQYWQHQHRPQREPTLPNLQTQVPPAIAPTASVGSIDQQMARSPAKDYHDQQTPWSISLPQDGSNRQSNAPSWAQQPPNPPPHQQYRGAPAAARGAVRTQSPPQHQDQYSSMTPYQFIPPPQQVQNSALHAQQRQSSHYGEQVSSPTTYTTTSAHQPSHPAPYSPVSPISPQSYEYASPDQYHNAYAAQPPQHQQQPRQPQHQNRYYSQSQGQGAPRSAGPGPQRHFNPNDEGRPLTYQRTPSGYSGRRDDAGVSESEILNMRGASYPGQEWTPGRG